MNERYSQPFPGQSHINSLVVFMHKSQFLFSCLSNCLLQKLQKVQSTEACTDLWALRTQHKHCVFFLILNLAPLQNHAIRSPHFFLTDQIWVQLLAQLCLFEHCTLRFTVFHWHPYRSWKPRHSHIYLSHSRVIPPEMNSLMNSDASYNL